MGGFACVGTPGWCKRREFRRCHWCCSSTEKELGAGGCRCGSARGRKDYQSKEMPFVWYRCCLSWFGCGGVFDVFVFSAKFKSWFQVARVLQPYHCSLGCKQEWPGFEGIFTLSSWQSLGTSGRLVDLDLIGILSLRSKQWLSCSCSFEQCSCFLSIVNLLWSSWWKSEAPELHWFGW